MKVALTRVVVVVMVGLFFLSLLTCSMLRVKEVGDRWGDPSAVHMAGVMSCGVIRRMLVHMAQAREVIWPCRGTDGRYLSRAFEESAADVMR